MSLTQASAQIQDSNKQLINEWAKLKVKWQDSNAQKFEIDVIQSLLRESEKSYKAMKHMNTILQRIKRDCQ